MTATTPTHVVLVSDFAQALHNYTEANRGNSALTIGLARDAMTEARQALYAALAAQQPTPAASPDNFDLWVKNPYTLVLQKSIAEDYVPRHSEQVEVAAPVAPTSPHPEFDRGFSEGWDRATAHAALSAAQPQVLSDAQIEPSPAPVQPDWRDLVEPETQSMSDNAGSHRQPLHKSVQPQAAPAKLSELIVAGKALANIAHNLAQWPGHTLTSDNCETMHRCCVEFDAALAAMKGTK